MRRSPVPVVVIALAAALIGLLAYALIGGSSGESTLDTQVQAGELPPAPLASTEFANLAGGGTTSVASLQGKVAVVNIWASWCRPCQDEAPILSAAHDALTEGGDGQVLGVTHQDASDDSLGFERDHAITFPSVRDPEDALYKAYGGTGVPETYVLDAQGRVVAIARRPITAEWLNGALREAGATTQVTAEQIASAEQAAERAKANRTATGSGT